MTYNRLAFFKDVNASGSILSIWFELNVLQNKTSIRRRSDYIIGFDAPAIGPNKSKKLTRLIALALNIRGKV